MTCPYCAFQIEHAPPVCAVFNTPIVGFQGKHRFLSNFWPARVVFESVEYPSTENAYQATKTLDLNLRVPFETCSSAEAKRLSHKLAVRPDWPEVKLDIMKNLLSQKFFDKSLLQDLRETGKRLLVEGNNWHDNFWGDCSCGKKKTCESPGMNHFGKLLMEIRDRSD